MKAHIEYAWGTTAHRVWLYRPAGPGKQQFLLCKGSDAWEWTEILDGAEAPEPTLVLNDEVLKALIAEARNILPPSAATERHLKDALEVRDRALAMVEVAFKPIVRGPSA